MELVKPCGIQFDVKVQSLASDANSLILKVLYGRPLKIMTAVLFLEVICAGGGVFYHRIILKFGAKRVNDFMAKNDYIILWM